MSGVGVESDQKRVAAINTLPDLASLVSLCLCRFFMYQVNQQKGKCVLIKVRNLCTWPVLFPIQGRPL